MTQHLNLANKSIVNFLYRALDALQEESKGLRRTVPWSICTSELARALSLRLGLSHLQCRQVAKEWAAVRLGRSR